MRTIPAGITWQKVRGHGRWICTVRREPEVVYEAGDLAPYYSAQAMSAQQAAVMGSLHGPMTNRCPCCGQSRHGIGLGGLLGGLGL